MARLVKSFAAEDLALSLDEVDERLQQLLVLLPELGSRVATLKPVLLAALLRAPAVVAQRLVGLRLALPACNVKELVLRDPALLLREVDDVVGEMSVVAGVLGLSERVTQELVSLQPRFLDAEGMVEVVKELRRLLPGAEPGQVLRNDPSWLLRLERGPKKIGALPEDKCY
ncbi:hypothetical protein WJX81_007023 [Elliptochloris bilobata]|uniref:Uncharacterized protein n=1 Tax=Elliptochloris bilobata TaxID=381761 RepID=A0AAW1RV01_9CHLO